MTNFERIKGMSIYQLEKLKKNGGTGDKLLDFGCKLCLEIKKFDKLIERETQNI